MSIFANATNFTGKRQPQPNSAVSSPNSWRLLMLSCILLFSGMLQSVQAESYAYDPAGRLTSVSFDDGSSIAYEYDPAGNVLRIGKSVGAQPPDGEIDTPVDDVTINVGQAVNFTGTGGDPDGQLPLAFRWDFNGAAPDSMEEDPGMITFSAAGDYTVRFHVTDAAGLTDPTPAMRVITVQAAGGGGGANNGGNNNSSGGGSAGVLFLLVLFLTCLRRYARAIAAILVLALGPLQFAVAQEWVKLESGVDVSLRDVWGTASDNVYAVGVDGTILHYDGSAWSPMASGTTEALFAIYGYGPADIYTVGSNLTILHYDGTAWSPFAVPVEAVGGFVDVWTAGVGESLWLLAGNRAWHWDGANWIPEGFTEGLTRSFTPNARLQGIGGTASKIIVSAEPTSGLSGGLFANFNRVGFWSTNASFAVSENDIFAVGRESRRFEGDIVTFAAQWTAIFPMSFANDVWGTSSTNVYAVGVGQISPGGRISHYNGNATNSWTTELDRPFEVMRSIFGFAENDIFVVGDNGVILHLEEPEPPQTAANFPASGWVSDFVNSYTGELVLNQIDASVSSCMSLEFGRYYASLMTPPGQGGGPLGPNWRHSYQWDIALAPSNATVTTPHGRVVEFVRDAGGWRTEDQLESDLVLIDDVVANRTVLLDTKEDLFYSFSNSQNRLETIEDRAGNRLTLQYDASSGILLSITDGQKALAFAYDLGALTSVSIGAGATVSRYDYAYENGQLKTVTDPLGGVMTFNYESPFEDSLITSVQMPMGNVPYTWAYASDSRVTSEIDAFGNVWTSDYGSGTTPSSMAAPDGTRLRVIHDDNGQAVALINGADERYDVSYNTRGRVASVTTPAGGTTTFSYDPSTGLLNGRTEQSGSTATSSQIPVQTILGHTFYDVDTLTHADGSTVRYEYNAGGLRTAMIDQADRRWEYEYDSNGHLSATVMPNGGRHEIERGAGCQMSALQDPDGIRTQYTHDALNRLVTTRQPDGTAFSTTYDLAGNVTTKTSANGDVTAFDHDANGNLVSLESPGTALIEYRYDAMDRLSELQSPKGDVSSFVYDGLGRLVEASGPEGYRENISWTAADRAESFSVGGRTPLVMEYTSSGAPDALQLPNGRRLDLNTSVESGGRIDSYDNGFASAKKVRDANGRLAGVDNGDGQRVIGTEFDALGRVRKISMYDDFIRTLIDYNDADLPIRVTDPNGNIWHREWSLAGRLTSSTDPLGRQAMFNYDSAGHSSGATFPGGLGTINIVRNATGNAVQRNYSDGVSLAYNYDELGRLVDANGVELAYDDNGTMSNSNGLQIGYDTADRLTSIEVAPGRVVTYSYDDRGVLQEVTDWNGQAISFNTDEAGALRTINRSNSISTTLDYDADGRLDTIQETGRMDIALTFDDKGRPISAARNTPRPASVSSPSERVYTFDAASQTEQFSHDALGRRTSDQQRNYSWNLTGRVTGYVENGNSVTFGYDAIGFRNSRTDGTGTTEYVWNIGLDLPSPSIERRDGVDQRYYVYTPDGSLLYSIAADGTRLFYHYDEQGNTIYLSDDAGAVVAFYAYSPYGEVLAEQSSVSNPFTFMGQRGVMREGSSDLYYARARYYDASTARFLSRDAAESIMPKRVNPYQYGRGNPLIYRDPTGLAEETDDEGWLGWLKRKAMNVRDTAQEAVNVGLAAISYQTLKWERLATTGTDKLNALAYKVYEQLAEGERLRKVLMQRHRLGVGHNVAINAVQSRLNKVLRSSRTAQAARELRSRAYSVGGNVLGAIFAFVFEDTDQYTSGDAGEAAGRAAAAGTSTLINRHPVAGVVVGISTLVDIPIEYAVSKIYGIDGVRLGLHEVLFTPGRLITAALDDYHEGRRSGAPGSSLNRAVDQMSRPDDNLGAASHLLAHVLDGTVVPESVREAGRDIYKGTQIVGEGLDEGLGLSDKLAAAMVWLGL